jgi:preprotein translocase subunit SecY
VLGLRFFLVKPLVFDWSLKLALEIILALTTGSILSIWFSELITEEGLGNGSSMLIFINIVGSIPSSFKNINQTLLNKSSFLDNAITVFQGFIFYIIAVTIIIIFQDAYKEIDIVSAKQLNISPIENNQSVSRLKNSYIPLKINQGGIMPLVFSSTIAVFLSYPVQLILNSIFGTNSGVGGNLLSFYSVVLNFLLVICFSCFYAALILKPEDISQNLAKMAYSIPGIRQGKETTKYIEKTVARLAFMGGLFLAFLVFFPVILGNIFKSTVFNNVTSLLILIGVITDVTSQIRGYLITRRYEGFS